MKLHLLRANSTIYIREANPKAYMDDTQVFKEFTTKKDKTYFMEQFSELVEANICSKYDYYMNNVVIDNKPGLILERTNYMFLKHEGYEAIIPVNGISLYVNSGD